MLRNYDPGKVVITWGPITFLAPADGVFASAERAEDAFETSVGAAGDVTRVRNRNKVGTFTWTGQAASPTNDLLSEQLVIDELFGTAVYPLLVKDLQGTTLCEAAAAWIKKAPVVEFGDEASNREWAFDCAELQLWAGGALI